MPRPKKEGAPEPKKRSRHGCWPCKSRKIKCGEEKPACLNCEKQGDQCDYSIRLNWDGRGKKKEIESPGSATLQWTISSGTGQPSSATPSQADSPPAGPSTPASTVMRPLSHSPQTQPGMMMGSFPSPAYLSPNNAPRSLPTPKSYHDSPTLTQPTSAPSAQNLPPLMDGSFPQHYSPQFQGDSLEPPIPAIPAHLRVPAPQGPYSPQYHTQQQQYQHQQDDEGHRTKRVRMSPSLGNLEASFADPFHANAPIPGYPTSSPMSRPNPPQAVPLSPTSPPAGLPSSTEGRLSVDDARRRSDKSDDEPRKLSVQSLLSSNPDLEEEREPTADFRTYGFDQGRRDLDIPKNDDRNALVSFSPSTTLRQLDTEKFPAQEFNPRASQGFGFGMQPRNPQFEQREYYAEPVPVQIPLNLEPLPQSLTDNPMNLLYFHHFLNHTAKILVPHDCPDNPFRNILPRLAMSNEHLLSLLLAYSASHRARLLQQDEPINRIALWVSDVFPALRLSLQDSSTQISDANLATAIMLASLEIISPNAFEVSVPWQKHLSMAREMIIARGTYKRLDRSDKVSYFLVRWFAYLDVMGSLSGSNYDRPLRGAYETFGDESSENDLEIDCLLGFTTRCISVLAQVADLAKQCDVQRVLSQPNTASSTPALNPANALSNLDTINNGNSNTDGDSTTSSLITATIDPNWTPSSEIQKEAARLRLALSNPPLVRFKGCSHHKSDTLPDGRRDSNLVDYAEMVATNNAYHQAGLIHLYRRVLNKPSQTHDVQSCVTAIVGNLNKISDGGTAEACMIFPIFTAGCEAIGQHHRDTFLRRMRNVEGLGMAQAHKALSLMQKVWETGRPWETLVAGEFVG